MGFQRVSGGAAAGSRIIGIGVLAALVLIAAPPLGLAASTHVVQPHDWQLGFQEAATPVKDRIEGLHDILLVIITCISLFVMGLLVYVMVRFNARANPVPSRTSHNTWIEICWTIIPVLILIGIAIPSFKLMYYMDRTQDAGMTVKVTGHQWYWSYEYPDQGDFAFDSNVLSDADDAKAGKPRLLGVDNAVVVPVGAAIRVLISGTDVIHSWFLPAAGVQEYAVVGRTNESWMQFDREGVFYGQCNQICGVNHPFMPIEVHVVSKADFDTWVGQAKKKFAQNRPSQPGVETAGASAGPVALAQAQ